MLVRGGILTDWFAIGPWVEFDAAHIALSSLGAELGLEGLAKQFGSDV